MVMSGTEASSEAISTALGNWDTYCTSTQLCINNFFITQFAPNSSPTGPLELCFTLKVFYFTVCGFMFYSVYKFPFFSHCWQSKV